MRVIFLLIVVAVGWYLSVTLFTKRIEEEQSKFKVNVGKKILYVKDSATIVDYSMLNDNYTLSNGVTVDKSFVDNQLKK